MIVDASRGEIQLDDLFNAIEHDKDQVTQALDIYGDYLKIKNDNSINGQNKIKLLERILKLECIEKTIVNHNHENERSRINLKWTVLTECGIWYRKLSLYDKAIDHFEKANVINNRVSTIYYEMGMCYLELGNVYQVKLCFEKTIEISHEHIHWKCLEQIVYLYFILGNFSKCLEYIRIGYDHVATHQSIYDFGQTCLVLLEKSQPSMKLLIQKMFTNEIEYIEYDENLLTKIEEIKKNIIIFKRKLFRRKMIHNERKSLDEHISLENFQDFGQYLMKKIRESNNDNSKLCKIIDIKNFLPKQEIPVEKLEQISNVQQEPIIEDKRPQPPVNRKKRSSLPLNIDDYEKRRSARSTTRIMTDDTNISTVDKLRRMLSNNENSSDDEADETAISPENNDDELASTHLSELPKENFPSLQIDYKLFIQSIEQKTQDGYQYHYLDLICDYVHEITKHSSTLWSNEVRTTFTKLFDCLLDYVQYSATDIEINHLRACLCYVENAIGSSKSDLSEDSIERFSCFARLKIKYKSLGYCFARLQFYLYLFKNSSIQKEQFQIDEILYRILWISSLYYFLSDVQDDALVCIYQLQHLLPDTITIILPNLFNHTTISKNSIEKLYLRLKDNNEISSEQASSSSSSQELTYILSRIAVTEENDELALLIKKLEKKIKLFYANIKTDLNLQQKSLIKCYETLVNVLNENQHLNDKENFNVRKTFDQIFIQVIDMLIKILDEDFQWQDTSLKNIEKLTIRLIDSIMKRNESENIWPFSSIKPWILLYRVSIKRDPKKNEHFLISFVRTVHELFGKHELCLIESGALLEYFLIELIQIEHPDIRKRLFSNTSYNMKSSNTSDDSNEQKSKLSKVIDEIEQCIYCLYGLVLRKSKMKYLNDHNCRSLELTLDKASIVFYALRPKHIPGYEGRLCTITNETESLFQRFESMIEWDDEREQRRKILLAHIADAASINSQGKQSEELIHLSDKPFKLKNALFEKDLYYLFADYYLKMGSKDAVTNESSKKKAQEYYIKDLCMNTKRFDSWAGLTVIEFYKIEEFITADDFDPRIFNVHMSASCFFRQAVSVDSNNHTLWMEYAEITYILQSYCSKYKDKAADYVPDRSFLLSICKEAYEKANVCTDNDENKEDWTYLYMMAKIEEKLHRNKLFDPLKKYVSALDLLHENKAVYPRKLGHHTSTSNSKGTLLGCHAVEMFYRIHSSTLKYLNRHSKESADLTSDKLNEFHEFLTEMQTKPFATSYYEKSTIPSDSHSSQLISSQYFPNKTDLITNNWLILYHKCIWLCIEGLYICIARYNRHYRGLYRLAHFFHTNEYYRNDRLSLEFLLGGGVLELKNYPKVIGLYQERSKHNLFNGIWRIQPLDADRTGSFNASMYKSTRLFIDLLLQSDENLFILIEVLRQLLEKPDLDKKYLREVERKILCQHAIKNIFRTIKKKILLKTRDDIEREGLQIIAAIDDNDPTNIPQPALFEISIKFYSLIKNYPDFSQNSRFDELVELAFKRYRPILKFSNHLPENSKAENLIAIYTQKKPKPKKRPATTEQSSTNKRLCPEPATTTTVRPTPSAAAAAAAATSVVQAPSLQSTASRTPTATASIAQASSSQSTATLTPSATASITQASSSQSMATRISPATTATTTTTSTQAQSAASRESPAKTAIAVAQALPPHSTSRLPHAEAAVPQSTPSQLTTIRAPTTVTTTEPKQSLSPQPTTGIRAPRTSATTAIEPIHSLSPKTRTAIWAPQLSITTTTTTTTESRQSLSPQSTKSIRAPSPVMATELRKSLSPQSTTAIWAPQLSLATTTELRRSLSPQPIAATRLLSPSGTTITTTSILSPQSITTRTSPLSITTTSLASSPKATRTAIISPPSVPQATKLLLAEISPTPATTILQAPTSIFIPPSPPPPPPTLVTTVTPILMSSSCPPPISEPLIPTKVMDPPATTIIKEPLTTATTTLLTSPGSPPPPTSTTIQSPMIIEISPSPPSKTPTPPLPTTTIIETSMIVETISPSPPPPTATIIEAPMILETISPSPPPLTTAIQSPIIIEISPSPSPKTPTPSPPTATIIEAPMILETISPSPPTPTPPPPPPTTIQSPMIIDISPSPPSKTPTPPPSTTATIETPMILETISPSPPPPLSPTEPFQGLASFISHSFVPYDE